MLLTSRCINCAAQGQTQKQRLSSVIVSHQNSRSTAAPRGAASQLTPLPLLSMADGSEPPEPLVAMGKRDRDDLGIASTEALDNEPGQQRRRVAEEFGGVPFCFDRSRPRSSARVQSCLGDRRLVCSGAIGSCWAVPPTLQHARFSFHERSSLTTCTFSVHACMQAMST